MCDMAADGPSPGRGARRSHARAGSTIGGASGGRDAETGPFAMRRDIQRAAEWLVANPWALVAAVALVIVVPILLLGELSASDTQRRLRAERLALGAQAANRGADAIQTQLSLSLQQLVSLG